MIIRQVHGSIQNEVGFQFLELVVRVRVIMTLFNSNPSLHSQMSLNSLLHTKDMFLVVLKDEHKKDLECDAAAQSACNQCLGGVPEIEGMPAVITVIE